LGFTWVENNTVVGPGWNGGFGIFWGVGVDESVYVRNCIVTNCRAGILGDTGEFINYNDVWGNKKNYFAGSSGDRDISQDPMFVDSLDFHLQKFSPCIDAGVPEILDVDSTRSDMGAYGGPGGETYFYQNLPPKAPDSLIAEALPDSSGIFLDWNDNTESDLFGYLIYRDTNENFIPNEYDVIGFASEDSSFYFDYDIELGFDYYYRVRAYDSVLQGGEYSEEVKVVLTGVEEEEKEVPISFKLYQNYPNPFNSSTTIPFHISCKSQEARDETPILTLMKVYNIRGELVRILLDDYLREGNHQVIWDGKDEAGEEVSSGVYFYLLRAGQNKKVKRMIYLK